MRTIISRLLIVVGALTMALLLLGVVVGLARLAGAPGVPERVVLEVNLERPLIEATPSDPLAQVLGQGQATLRDVVEALERASADDRVVALLARVGQSGMGLARIQEIRDAVIAFRSQGKRAVAFSETFGEFGPGNGAYYLATAFDQIHLQPSGDIGLTGLVSESMFLRGALEKLGVEPRGDHRYEYKNALNLFTERAYTDAHREASKALIDSGFAQIVAGIAAGRGVSEGEVRAAIDRGPLVADEAVEARLVDGLSYRDEVYDEVLAAAGEGAEILPLSSYLERAGRPHSEGAQVALIYGVGGVARGKSRYDPVQGQLIMGADTVAGAFRAALEDDEVRAILFRIDSPGGSYVASDAIWREVVRAREGGKPVIASMGDVAGSGGYFVAMAADKIVAQPGTLTGSIGVLGFKPLTSGLWEKLGVSWDEVHTSAHSLMWTGTHDYSPEEWARFQTWLDRVYEDFTSKVAEGRDLPTERVLEIARGRIWSGADALERGLVDELGGFAASLRLVRQALELPEDAAIQLRVFPPPKTTAQALLELAFGGGGEQTSQPTSLLLARALQAMQPLGQLARELGLGEPRGVLQMPPVP